MRFSTQALKMHYKSAMSDIRQSKRQSIVAVLSLAIASVSLFTFLSLASYNKANLQIENSNLYISDQATITAADVKSKLGGKEELYKYSIFRDCPQGAANDQNLVIQKCIITDHHFIDVLDLKVKYGQNLDSNSNQDNVVVGSELAKSGFSQQQDAISNKIDIYGVKKTIIGVLGQNDSFDSANLSDINSLAIVGISSPNTGDETKFYLIVKDDGNQGLEKLNVALGNNVKFNVLKHKVENVTAKQDVERMVETTKAVAAVAMLMSGLCVFISSILSTDKRMKEIGIRKTIGATNRQISSYFVVESIILGFIGAVSGISIGYTLLGIKSKQIFLQMIAQNITNAFSTILVIILLSLLFGIIPAITAGRKNPIECLKRID